MYLPPQFRVRDRAWTVELIERHPFGLLITGDAAYPLVSHVPVVAEMRNDELWLVGHVAAANPHAESIRAHACATIVVQGAHAYVSAAWYEEPYATVPTWNYVAAHACGHLQPCDAWHAVRRLTERMERDRNEPWLAEGLAPGYRESQLRGIVAFELRAESVYAKAKLSQNRTQEDRGRVIEQLAASSDQTDRECAEAMRTIEPPLVDRDAHGR